MREPGAFTGCKYTTFFRGKNPLSVLFFHKGGVPSEWGQKKLPPK